MEIFRIAGSQGVERLCVCRLSVSFFGLGIRAFTIGHTPKGTSGRNTRGQVAETLNTKGIYSLVRNPLYLGNFFMGLGPALMVHEWWLTVIYVLTFWLYYERIIYAEESFLEAKFGTTFTEWARVTPCIQPKLTGYRKPDLAFSARNVLRREYNGFFAVVLVLFMLETVADLSVLGRFEFEKEWLFLVAVSFAAWLTLRLLKRHTGLLKVDGR